MKTKLKINAMAAWSLMLASHFSFCASAATETVGGYTWKYRIDDSNAIVTGPLSPLPVGSVSIPNTLGGCPVKRIGANAFSNCVDMTSIIIPDTTVSIEDGAFWRCHKLETVVIPNGITNIGNQAFYACVKMANFPAPSALLSIGDEAFYGCAFTTASIPANTRNIGKLAFERCSSLTSVTVPLRVRSIGVGAFANCARLTSISVDSNSDYFYSTGALLFTKDKATLLACVGRPNFQSTLYLNRQSVTITNIADYAFCGCHISIELNNELQSIGSHAFENSNLSSIEIPHLIKNIPDYAFADCHSLESVSLPSNLEHIGNHAFDTCYKIERITIPSSVEHIGEYAFSKCIGLTRFSIPSDVTTIEAGTFKGCRFTSFTIPDTIQSIGPMAFADNESLSSISIPNKVEEIGSCAFSNCTNLQSAVVGNAIRSIGSYAFDGCNRMTSISFPQTINPFPHDGGIDIGAFRCCSALKSIELPGGLISIGYETFSGCTKLESVSIPASVNSIHNEAFYNCTNLKRLNLPLLSSGFSGKPFLGCSSLYEITVWNRNVAELRTALTNSGISLDAVELIIRYSITYADTKGRTVSSPISYFQGDEITFLPLQNVKGYAFAGWNPSSITSDMAADVTVEAQWNPITYTVRFDSNGGTGNMSAQSMTYDKPQTLSQSSFVFDRYSFDGWATSANGGVVYLDNATVSNLASNAGAEVRLYAVWRETTVATPQISPEDGTTFSSDACTISMSCDTQGAEIYYTTNGTTPKASSSYHYTGPFTINSSVVIKAMATKSGLTKSAYASAIITKTSLSMRSALDADSSVSISTGGKSDWYPVDDSSAKVGNSSAKSGLCNADDDEESWLLLSVSGAGTLSFWCKTSCEHDDDNTFTWDRLSIYTNDCEISEWRMDGTADWTQRTISFTDSGSHSIKIVYHKDDSGYENEDCAWVDGIVWSMVETIDAIPDIGDSPTTQQIQQALAGSADAERLIAHITDGDTYNEYREWANKICGNDFAKRQAVKDSIHAWLSFALDANALIINAPAQGDLTIDTFKPSATSGSFDFEISIKDITIGDEATAANIAEIFGIEGAETPSGAYSSSNVEVVFGPPQNGSVKCTAKPKDTAKTSFFMRVKMNP